MSRGKYCYKLSLGKDSLVNTARKLNFGIFFGASPFGLSGSNGMIGSSTMNSGTKLRSNTAFGMNLSFTLKRLGTGWSNKSKLAASPRRRCSKDLTGLGVLGMCYVEDATCMLNGIGKAKLVGSDLLLVAWGLSLTSGVGLVLGLVVPCPWWGLFVLPLYLAVFRVRGALPPLSMGAFFLWFQFIWRWLGWPSVSKK